MLQNKMDMNSNYWKLKYTLIQVTFLFQEVGLKFNCGPSKEEGGRGEFCWELKGPKDADQSVLAGTGTFT